MFVLHAGVQANIGHGLKSSRDLWGFWLAMYAAIFDDLSCLFSYLFCGPSLGLHKHVTVQLSRCTFGRPPPSHFIHRSYLIRTTDISPLLSSIMNNVALYSHSDFDSANRVNRLIKL